MERKLPLHKHPEMSSPATQVAAKNRLLLVTLLAGKVLKRKSPAKKEPHHKTGFFHLHQASLSTVLQRAFLPFLLPLRPLPASASRNPGPPSPIHPADSSLPG